MKETNIDDLLLKAGNKFLLVNAAAGRAKQIINGSLPYVNNFDPNNPNITALREIAAGKINVKVLAGPAQKTQELLVTEEEKKERRPSAMERLAKDSKRESKKPVKEKKKK